MLKLNEEIQRPLDALIRAKVTLDSFPTSEDPFVVESVHEIRTACSQGISLLQNLDIFSKFETEVVVWSFQLMPLHHFLQLLEEDIRTQVCSLFVVDFIDILIYKQIFR